MQKKIILGIIILLLAIGASYYIYRDLVRPPMSNISPEPTPGVGENQLPNLDRLITIPDNYPLAQKESLQKTMESLISSLKQNPDLFDSWIELGLYRKAIEDYEGAKECWEYASAIRPGNSLSFGNLGILYGYYLKDYEKAEKNFLQAINNDSHLIYLYAQTFEFYRDVLKNKTKARQILEQGIKANPENSQDLQNLLNNF